MSRGPGGPTRNSCRVRYSVLNPTRVALERLAKERNCYNGGHLEVGRLLDQLVEEMEVFKTLPVPKYLALAREAGLVIVRS